MASYNLTIRVLEKRTQQDFAWWIIVDGQPLGDVRQSTYAVTMLEGNHVVELPPCPIGAYYRSLVWRDVAGNILGEETALSLNLISDQQITLTIELAGGFPVPAIAALLVVFGLTIATIFVGWRVIKKVRS